MTLKAEVKEIVKEALTEVLTELGVAVSKAVEENKAEEEAAPKKVTKKVTKWKSVPKEKEVEAEDSFLDVGDDELPEEKPTALSAKEFFAAIRNLVVKNPEMQDEVCELCTKVAGTFRIKEITDEKHILEISDALNLS